MINGSFVFGMDGDDASVFERTVEWAIEQGIETATFHILTPYPGTALYAASRTQGRITIHDWDLLRHAPRRLPPGAHVGRGARTRVLAGLPRVLSLGVDRPRRARRTASVVAGLRHVAYAAGWKKFEPLWDLVIRARRAGDDAAGARDDPQRVRPACARVGAGHDRWATQPDAEQAGAVQVPVPERIQIEPRASKS